MKEQETTEMICENCKWFLNNQCIESEPKKTLPKSHCAAWEKISDEEIKEIMTTCYRNIIDILKTYCDLKEEYYSLIAIWILGTYSHSNFETYPYLFINATKGSGKTRLLKLIAKLSLNGDVSNSLREAVLFRTSGTLCIDEFEGITRSGNENLRELLNSAYKKGTKVKRMRKAKGLDGEQQVVEEFEVYRPIVLANIWGMENVLGDRCISIILEKSENKQITRKIEIFDYDPLITSTLNTLSSLTTQKTQKNDQKNGKNPNWCSLCSVVTPEHCHQRWNDYVENKHIYTHITHTQYYTKLHTLFRKVYDSDIDGRNLELSLPLFIVSFSLEEEILNNLIDTIKEIINEKKVEEFASNYDVSLIDFISQEPDESFYISITKLTNNFKNFLQINEDWIKPKWVGRALKRLGLVKQKKRQRRGIEVLLDIKKAQQKIKMFK